MVRASIVIAMVIAWTVAYTFAYLLFIRVVPESKDKIERNNKVSREFETGNLMTTEVTPSIFSFIASDGISQESLKLSKYRGKEAYLVVNVASK